MSAGSLVAVPNINLSRIIVQVQRSNPDWDDGRLNEAAREYLRFLQLCKMNPELKISAPPDIDMFWHAHMLDSVNYCRDCNEYFGRYLHHDPCLGESADLDTVNRTLNIYSATFGVNPTPAWMGLMTCANPGNGCGSMPVH